MKNLNGQSLFNKVKSIVEKDDFFIDLLNTNKRFEQISRNTDLYFNEVSGENYSGYWAWTSGGIIVQFSVDVNFLLSTGYYNSNNRIGEFIQTMDEKAHKYAIEHLGEERNDSNEDEYFEYHHDYLSDVTVDFDIRFVLIKPTDFAYNSEIGNGKTYIKADCAVNEQNKCDLYCLDFTKLNKFIKDSYKKFAEKFNQTL